MRLIPALAALALFPSTAAAAPTFFAHPKGDLGVPTTLHSSAGCVDHDTFLWPMQHTDGTRGAFAEVTDYDHCADALLLDHVGSADSLTAAELSIATDLSSASLSATIPMNDALADGFPATDSLTVDLSWAGTGRQDRDNVLYENGHSEGVTLINHDHEACRDATVSGAPAGTVADARICRQIAGSLFLFIE
jgi:hypothetical protein